MLFIVSTSRSCSSIRGRPFGSLGLFAVVEMLLFMLTVFVAYAYVWRARRIELD